MCREEPGEEPGDWNQEGGSQPSREDGDAALAGYFRVCGPVVHLLGKSLFSREIIFYVF